jgi:pimeloyl-ACP methyl ester carboxylesterase
MRTPAIHFTSTPGGKIAYQVVGEGPTDLFFVPNLFPNLDVVWEHPPLERFFRRLATFSRLILYNGLGTGISDGVGVGTTITPEENMIGIRDVLDAVGSSEASLLATEAGGMPSLFFAATFPERIRSLTLLNSYATLRREEDYPWGFPPSAMDR